MAYLFKSNAEERRCVFFLLFHHRIFLCSIAKWFISYLLGVFVGLMEDKIENKHIKLAPF